MKIVKRVAWLASVLLLASLILNSCVSKNDEEFPFIPLYTEDNEITSEGSAMLEYRVVLPRPSSAELSEAAEKLCDALAEQTATDVYIIYENEYTERRKNEWDVYIGAVSLLEAHSRLRNLRSEDFTCRSYDGFTVMGGRNDSTTIAAIERFCEEILPVSDACCLIPDGGGFDYTGSYETESLNIGDAAVSDFEIVYSTYDTGALAVASELQRRISDTFGYWLELSADRDSATKRGIYLDIDSFGCEQGRAELLFSGNDITLTAPELYGLEIAADKLFGLLCADGNSGSLSPKLPEHLYLPYGDTECSIASLALYQLLPFDAPREVTYVTDALDTYSPDAFLCGEIDADSKELLILGLTEHSAVQSSGGAAFARADTSVTELSVRRENCLLIEMLQIKRGELEFIFVHIGGTAEQAAELDISELVGNTPFPVVAVVHTYNSNEVTLRHSGDAYFDRVILDETIYYEDTFTYACYADTSRLSVTESEGNADRFDYRQITVAVP